MEKTAAKIIGILAITPEGVLGNNRKPPRFLPWDKLEGDLPRFKATTEGSVIIMGRKTCEILRKPLPGRVNVVLSRDPNWQAPEGFHKFKALSTAVQFYEYRTEKIFLISGTVVEFAVEENILDEMILTETYENFPGDIIFRGFDKSQWKKHTDEFPDFGYNVVHYYKNGRVH